jgi:hypothetical protein
MSRHHDHFDDDYDDDERDYPRARAGREIEIGVPRVR